jgi:gamma-glutamyl-gamma-aminobutyrate hydrolase PuuD
MPHTTPRNNQRRRRRPQPVTPPQPLSTWRGFGFSIFSEKRRKQARDGVSKAHAERPTPTTHIIYRPDGNIRGKGAWFDHNAVQRTSDFPTAVFAPNGQHLDEYAENHGGARPPYAPSPAIVTRPQDMNGLLYIPGIPRDKKESAEILAPRLREHEAAIREAINRGMPILAVCGGSWELWNHYGGSLVPVKDHSCSMGMPMLISGNKVGRNKQVHRIKPTDEGLIFRGAMQYDKHSAVNPLPAVNSVHWQAPSKDPDEIPAQFEISALSVHDAALAPKHRVGCAMKPEEGVVEAFESVAGAPQIGTSFHPEAYTANTDAQFHPEQFQHILKYMAEAGRTYLLRQQLNTEFSARVATPTDPITPGDGKVEVSDTPTPPMVHASELSRLTFWQQEYLQDQVLKSPEWVQAYDPSLETQVVGDEVRLVTVI